MEAYFPAWRGVIGSLRQPTPANGLVSNHLFMPFNERIFAHDTAVMSLFARYGRDHWAKPPGDPDARRHDGEAARLSRLIRSKMWDEDRGFFLDLDRVRVE